MSYSPGPLLVWWLGVSGLALHHVIFPEGCENWWAPPFLPLFLVLLEDLDGVFYSMSLITMRVQ